jgi:hypothetical protein
MGNPTLLEFSADRNDVRFIAHENLNLFSQHHVEASREQWPGSEASCRN